MRGYGKHPAADVTTIDLFAFCAQQTGCAGPPVPDAPRVRITAVELLGSGDPEAGLNFVNVDAFWAW